MADEIDLAVIGGSGFYSLLESPERLHVDTPYGDPSDSIAIGEVGDRRVAFLPRHGSGHSVPPHMINYRANVWALHHLGAKVVVSVSAVGSLQPDVHPGDVVLCDQFIDRTKKRQDTFFEGPIVRHVSPADMYAPELRAVAETVCQNAGFTVRNGGTVVVIEGPRFSTKAESRWFHSLGGHIIGMTQYPEAYLCVELGMGVVNLSLVTDYDSGIHTETEAVTHEAVLEAFARNADRLKGAVRSLLVELPSDLTPFYERVERPDVIDANPAN